MGQRRRAFARNNASQQGGAADNRGQNQNNTAKRSERVSGRRKDDGDWGWGRIGKRGRGRGKRGTAVGGRAIGRTTTDGVWSDGERADGRTDGWTCGDGGGRRELRHAAGERVRVDPRSHRGAQIGTSSTLERRTHGARRDRETVAVVVVAATVVSGRGQAEQGRSGVGWGRGQDNRGGCGG